MRPFSPRMERLRKRPTNGVAICWRAIALAGAALWISQWPLQGAYGGLPQPSAAPGNAGAITELQLSSTSPSPPPSQDNRDRGGQLSLSKQGAEALKVRSLGFTNARHKPAAPYVTDGSSSPKHNEPPANTADLFRATPARAAQQRYTSVAEWPASLGGNGGAARYYRIPGSSAALLHQGRIGTGSPMQPQMPYVPVTEENSYPEPLSPAVTYAVEAEGEPLNRVPNVTTSLPPLRSALPTTPVNTARTPAQLVSMGVTDPAVIAGNPFLALASGQFSIPGRVSNTFAGSIASAAAAAAAPTGPSATPASVRAPKDAVKVGSNDTAPPRDTPAAPQVWTAAAPRSNGVGEQLGAGAPGSPLSAGAASQPGAIRARRGSLRADQSLQATENSDSFLEAKIPTTITVLSAGEPLPEQRLTQPLAVPGRLPGATIVTPAVQTEKPVEPSISQTATSSITPVMPSSTSFPTATQQQEQEGIALQAPIQNTETLQSSSLSAEAGEAIAAVQTNATAGEENPDPLKLAVVEEESSLLNVSQQKNRPVLAQAPVSLSRILSSPREACLKVITDEHLNVAYVCCTVESGYWSDAKIWDCQRVPNEGDTVVVLHRVEMNTAEGERSVRVRSLFILTTETQTALLRGGRPFWDICKALLMRSYRRWATGQLPLYRFPWNFLSVTLNDIFSDFFRKILHIQEICDALAEPVDVPVNKQNVILFVGSVSDASRRLNVQRSEKKGTSRKQSMARYLLTVSQGSHQVFRRIMKRRLSLSRVQKRKMQSAQNAAEDKKLPESRFFVGPGAALAFFEGISVGVGSDVVLENNGTFFIGLNVHPKCTTALETGGLDPSCVQPSLEVEASTVIQASRPIRIARLDVWPQRPSSSSPLETAAYWGGRIGFPTMLPYAELSALTLYAGTYSFQYLAPDLFLSFRKLQFATVESPGPESIRTTRLDVVAPPPLSGLSLSIAVDEIASTGYEAIHFITSNTGINLLKYADEDLLVSTNLTIEGDAVFVGRRVTSNDFFSLASSAEPLESSDYPTNQNVKRNKGECLSLTCLDVCVIGNQLYENPQIGIPVHVPCAIV